MKVILVEDVKALGKKVPSMVGVWNVTVSPLVSVSSFGSENCVFFSHFARNESLLFRLTRP